MLRDSGEHPVTLREAVTSPGGTTINAIRELERHGVRAAMLAALVVIYRRAGDDFLREVHQGLDAVIALPEIEAEVPLAEIYDRVVFSPEPGDDGSSDST